MYDFIIIGAGVIGAHIARELSRYEVKACIVEKSDDVSNGASKANSGIIHGGYAAKYGTLKGTLNVIGNKMFARLNKELNFGYRKTGGMVLGFNNADRDVLMELYTNGIKNGVPDLKIIERNEILELEPSISGRVQCALYTGELGVTSPYEYNIALAENAIKNGVELFLNTEVQAIHAEQGFYTVETNNRVFSTRYIINAAGIFSDKVSQMAGINYFSLTPRKGQYILFRKGTGSLVKRVIFQVPTKRGKGILVTSTFHGNLMIGPNSEETGDRIDTGTDTEILDYILATAKKSVPGIDTKKVLKTFSGIRPTPSTKDFIIREESPGFINAAGIESPGLTSSPAIAKLVINLVHQNFDLHTKKSFNPYREAIIVKKDLSDTEIKRRIQLDSSPEKIICRCEQVSEGEIVNALHRNIPVHTTYAVKKRTRAGMGRCQGNFCGPRVQEIINRETGREK